MSSPVYSLRGAGNVEGSVVEEYSFPRSLVDVDVEAYGNDGFCVARTSLDTLYSGSLGAAGTMFSVTAKEYIEILSFEFSNLPSDDDLEVEIYTRSGTEYISVSNEPTMWTKLSATIAVDSPNGLGAVAPRADMQRSVQMTAGESRSFYFTLKSQHLQVDTPDEGVVTGAPFISDDRLQINVGVSLRFYPFPKLVDMDRAFQGKIHYRSIEPCDQWEESTEITMPFAVNATGDIRDVNAALTNGFADVLDSEAILSRLKNLHGLRLDGLDAKNKGTRDECSEYGFEGGCTLLDTVLTFKHYQSLSRKQIMIDMTRTVNRNEGVPFENRLFVMKYIGDEVFQANYDIFLTGVPGDTILNPIQRNYIEDVTFDFLETFSDSEVYGFEVRGQVFETDGQRLLRGLQESGTVQVESTAYGIGDDSEEFLVDVDDAFSLNAAQFLKEISLQQYFPGEINDNEDFGLLFSKLFSVTVLRSRTNETVAPIADAGAEKEKGFTTDLQIIVWSVVLGLSILFLLYKCWSDLFCVSGDSRIRKTKLSEKIKDDRKTERKVQEQSMIDNLDQKSKRKPLTKSNSFTGNNKAVPDKENIKSSSREPTRGVAKSNTFSGPQGFFGSKLKPEDDKTSGRREPAQRGVGKSSTFSGVEGFFGSKLKPENTTQTERPARRPSPQRGSGLGKSNTFSGVEGFYGSKAQSEGPQKGRREPAKRGVKKSNTSDGLSFPAPVANSERVGRAAPASRGVGKSNTFGGMAGFFGDNQKPQKRPSWTATNSAVPPPPPPRRPEPVRGVGRSKTMPGQSAPGQPQRNKSTPGAPPKKGTKKKKKLRDSGGNMSGTTGSSKSSKSKKSKKSKSPSDNPPSTPPRRVDMTGRRPSL